MCAVCAGCGFRLRRTNDADVAIPSKPRQFYKKEHRWQEGLVSAAQAVGWGANELVTAAVEALHYY